MNSRKRLFEPMEQSQIKDFLSQLGRSAKSVDSEKKATSKGTK